MSTIELEAQKASLAREILSLDDETMMNNMWLFLKGSIPTTNPQEKSQKREIGFLKGKAKVIFHDDWEMTPEELEMI
jgi:hypothetical protein